MFISTIKFEKNVMFTAWNIAKEAFNHFGNGSVKQYFKESLKLAWKLFKGLFTPELDKTIDAENEALIERYMGTKLITMYEKDVFFERLESLKNYIGKEVKRKDLFFDKVKEGYKLEQITMMVQGGKYLNKIALTDGKSAIFGLNEMDKKYIAFLIRNVKTEK